MKHLSAAIIVLLMACNSPKHEHPHVLITTSIGDMEAEIYTDKAPVSANAFLQYVDSGIYNNRSFYRVVLAEGASINTNTGIIQAGTWPDSNNRYSFVHLLPHESTIQTGLSHSNGTLSLARLAPGTASTEFFICLGDQTQFDANKASTDTAGFAAFGRVVKGMNVARQIQVQPANGENFASKIAIYTITRL